MYGCETVYWILGYLPVVNTPKKDSHSLSNHQLPLAPHLVVSPIHARIMILCRFYSGNYSFCVFVSYHLCCVQKTVFHRNFPIVWPLEFFNIGRHLQYKWWTWDGFPHYMKTVYNAICNRQTSDGKARGRYNHGFYIHTNCKIKMLIMGALMVWHILVRR